MTRLILLALVSAPVWAQCTVSVTNPSANQVVMPAYDSLGRNNFQIQLNAAVSNCPPAWRVDWSVNYKYFNSGYAKPDPNAISSLWTKWLGPWAVTYWPGLHGDGPTTVQATVKDIFGATLAASAIVTFQARLLGASNNSIAAVTSGTGTVQFNSSEQFNCDISIDGRINLPGDDWKGSASNSPCRFSQVKTFRFPNGNREVYMYTNATTAYNDPVVRAATFTPGNVSGNNITLTGHTAVTGTPVVFGGTPPAPLAAGTAWFWGASGSNPSNTASLTVANGIATFTCSSACGATAGTPIYVRNVNSFSQSTGAPLCDGYYAASGGAGISFTVSMPSCPNLSQGASPQGLELYVNPYFAQYVDANTVSVSSTPGGSTVSLANSGSGTMTAAYRFRSPFWIGNGSGDAVDGTAMSAYALQMADFENGSAQMELRPPYWELHGIAGGTGVNICPTVYNTDLSTSKPACNATNFTFSVVPDGGYTGVIGVDTSGNVSYLSPGWAQISVACAAGGACAGLPPVTVYAQVQSGSVTFPHFTHGGGIAMAYTPGSSYVPLSLWHLSGLSSTTYQQTPAARTMWLGPLMQQSNINTTVEGMNGDMANPQYTNCAGQINGEMGKYTPLRDQFAKVWGTYMEYEITSLMWPPWYLAAFTNNQGFDRQTCAKSFLSTLKSDGFVYRVFGLDEINGYLAGSWPLKTSTVGTTNFTSVVVSGGVATANVLMSLEPAWNQAAGTGAAVNITGATNTCLNGWHLVTSTSGGTSFTFNTNCPSGTYNAGSDPAMTLNYLYLSTAQHQCVLPAYVGTNDTVTQPWDSNLTSMVSDGSTLTIHWTNHGLLTGQAIMIHSAANTNLHNIAAVTRVDANTITIPTLAAAGTYNAATDPNLYITVDCGFNASPMQTLRNVLTAAGAPAQVYGILGFSYSAANGQTVRNWEGDPNFVDAALNYNPGTLAAIYGDDGSVQQAAQAGYNSGLLTRAYQIQPRSTLFGVGGQWAKFHKSWGFDPATDRPYSLYWRPETLVVGLMNPITWGQMALRGYNFQTNSNLSLEYNGVMDLTHLPGENSISHYFFPRQWSALAHSFALIHRLEKYLLQPPMNSPYLGPMFSTAAHTSSYGNMLMIVCENETPYRQTVDLTPYRLSGGTMRRYSLTGYRLTATPLPGNPAGDTYNFCGTAPGETVVYVSQPAGAAPDLDNIAMAPPASLPLGASKMLVRYGYYPLAMQDDPVTDCTSACTITVDHYNSDAWYQIIYTDANGVPKSIGDPQKIAKAGN